MKTNTEADPLRGDLYPKLEIATLAIFCGCTARIVSNAVGNTEDRSSPGGAHLKGEKISHKVAPSVCIFALFKNVNWYTCSQNIEHIEPRCEKTGLRGFRPGPTQTGLYSHRRWLEAFNFGFRKKRDCAIHVAKTKPLISFAATAKLICVFVFAYAKSRFSQNEALLIKSLVSHVAIPPFNFKSSN